jgi:dTDP-4-amino-4,6-dideoxygalactose transaminase
MTSEDNPTNRVLVGVFGEGMPTHLFIPRDGLKPAERILDAERARHEALAAKAKLQTMQAARGRAKLKRALRSASD